MKKKWIVIAGIIFAVIILGLVVYEYTGGLEADLLEVSPGTIASSFREEGRVVPEVNRPVYALYPGKITELAVREGQQVKKGQFLASLESTEIDYQIEILEAQLMVIQGEKENIQHRQGVPESMIKSQELQVEMAEDSLETAKRNYQTIEQLYDDGTIDLETIIYLQNMLELAETNLELQRETMNLLIENTGTPAGADKVITGKTRAVQTQIDMLKQQKEKNTLYAPVGGIVANLTVKEGDMAIPQMPGAGSMGMGVPGFADSMGSMSIPGFPGGGLSAAQPVMNIFRPDSFVVEVYVLAADAPAIKKDMEVTLIRDGRDGSDVFAGKVTKIASSAEETMSALGLTEQRVKVTVRPEDHSVLPPFPGARLDVEFTLDKRDNVLVVPKSALFPYDREEALWVARDGRALIKPVVTGFEHERYVVIDDGLKEGDMVILNPQLEGLKEGKKIVANK